MYDRPNVANIVNAPRPVRLTNTQPTAKSLWDKLRTDHAEIEKWLEEQEETYDLSVELHTPAGTKIRIGNIAYYPDTNDALRVEGDDVSNPDEHCIAIVPVQSFVAVFRMRKVEEGEPERNRIGFRVYNAEGSEGT
jgi:hypothetical protein